MALGRIRRPENLRHFPPGELGKIIGLDRVPEVRTLREKIGILATQGDPRAWMQELSKSWMEDDPDEAGYLYVDGHVRVYHGDKANLPRRYGDAQRLLNQVKWIFAYQNAANRRKSRRTYLWGSPMSRGSGCVCAALRITG